MPLAVFGAHCALHIARVFPSWVPPLTDATLAPPLNQPELVATKMVIQCMMFHSRLHKAPRTGDTGENHSKRGDPQLLVRAPLLLLDLHVDLASPR